MNNVNVVIYIAAFISYISNHHFYSKPYIYTRHELNNVNVVLRITAYQNCSTPFVIDGGLGGLVLILYLSQMGYCLVYVLE